MTDVQAADPGMECSITPLSLIRSEHIESGRIGEDPEGIPNQSDAIHIFLRWRWKT